MPLKEMLCELSEAAAEKDSEKREKKKHRRRNSGSLESCPRCGVYESLEAGLKHQIKSMEEQMFTLKVRSK